MSAPEINDGGQAFPVPGLPSLPNGDFIYPTSGMSLRAYLMVHAPFEEIDTIARHNAKGLEAWLGIPEGSYDAGAHYAVVMAKSRRIWADAMLAAMEDGQ